MLSHELGAAVTMIVALGAGFIRGFTGFGGPAFMLATLTWFYTPLAVIAKILVIELISSAYLFMHARREIAWRDTAAITIPTILTLPLGQWLLLDTNPQVMRQIIAAIILIATVSMLLGLRYRAALGTLGLVVVGLLGGIIFGATYIALIVVAAILLGPYDRHASRALMISWSFFVSGAYAFMSFVSGAASVDDVLVALPGAAMYFIGTWFGARLFRGSAENMYRNVALVTLLILSIISFAT